MGVGVGVVCISDHMLCYHMLCYVMLCLSKKEEKDCRVQRWKSSCEKVGWFITFAGMHQVLIKQVGTNAFCD